MSQQYIYEPRPIFSSHTPNLLPGSYYIDDGFQADPSMWMDPLEDAFVTNAGMIEGKNDDNITYLEDFSAETILMGSKKLDELEVLPQSYFWKWVNYDGQVQIPTQMSEDDFESPAYERFMEAAVGYDADNPYFLLVVDSFMDDGEDVDIWAEEADWNRMQTTELWWKLYDLWMENEGVDFLTTVAEENYDWALANAYELQQIGYEIPEPDDDDYYWSMRQAESFEAPYTGAGSLMGISGDTDLSSFTPDELTKSSAIHGDFDTASLDYSGHQNLEVRAEDELDTCIGQLFDESTWSFSGRCGAPSVAEWGGSDETIKGPWCKDCLSALADEPDYDSEQRVWTILIDDNDAYSETFVFNSKKSAINFREAAMDSEYLQQQDIGVYNIVEQQVIDEEYPSDSYIADCLSIDCLKCGDDCGCDE